MNKYAAHKDDAKRDVTGLFKLYGAIDMVRESRPPTEERAPVERLLPVYMKEAPEVHWYRRYLAVSGVEPELDVEAIDPKVLVATVLAALAFLAKGRPKCRMRARRLYAVAAAAVAVRDLEGVEGVEGIEDEDLVAAALGAEDAEQVPGEDAKRLAELLRRGPDGPSRAAREEWWKEVVMKSGQDPEDVGPMPSACTVETTPMRVNGDIDPVPTFKTVFDAPLSFDQAREFFDPLTWICFPSWCAMEDLGKRNGVHQYCETVSFDCRDKQVLELVVNLDFEEWPVDPGPPKVATMEYQRSDDQPDPCYVLVNRGRLEIAELQGEPNPLVKITTTKSIKFTAELDALGLASFLCLSGYAGMVEDLVCCATKKREGIEAGEGADGAYPDIGFRGLEHVETTAG